MPEMVLDSVADFIVPLIAAIETARSCCNCGARHRGISQVGNFAGHIDDGLTTVQRCEIRICKEFPAIRLFQKMGKDALSASAIRGVFNHAVFLAHRMRVRVVDVFRLSQYGKVDTEHDIAQWMTNSAGLQVIYSRFVRQAV